MSAAAPKGLYPKLAAAIMEVDRIGKDGKNDHFKYTYTSAEQVYRTVRGPLLKQGLVVIPSVGEWSQQGPNMVLNLEMTITDVDSGESIVAKWVGVGQDKGDKASYKAATGGMKTWLKHLFMLPADDDPEADSSTDRPSPLDRLAAAADRVGMPAESRKFVGAWLHANGGTGPDPVRLKHGIEMIEANRVDDLLAEIEAEDV